MSQNFSFKIQIVYDNHCALDGFKKDFGFSALIYNHLTRNYILFDTGTNGRILLHNLSLLEINLNLIRKIVISHDHFDHSGGLKSIYNINPEIEIFVPGKDSSKYERKYEHARVHEMIDFKEIEKNVYSSGELFSNGIAEQCLFLKTLNSELIIIVGCAHPGLEKFIQQALKIGKVKGIIGGFHGFNKLEYLEGIDFISACHCTRKTREIRNMFPENFKQLCVGDKIEL